MGKLTATLCRTLTVIFGRVEMSLSSDFQKNAIALTDLIQRRGLFYKGDYATALREWKPLAKQGNASV